MKKLLCIFSLCVGLFAFSHTSFAEQLTRTEIQSNFLNRKFNNYNPHINYQNLIDISDSFYAFGSLNEINDNDITFSGDIEDIARLGVLSVNVSPASSSSNISTNVIRRTVCDTSNGSMTGLSHCIGGYDYLKLQGNNNSVLQIVHEAKLKKTGNGTVSHLVFYKPAIDEIEGTITKATIFDGDVDFSGISGSISEIKLLDNPYTDRVLETKGGILTSSKLILTSTYTATDNDCGTTLLGFASSTITFTVPSTITAGCEFTIIQGDANQITFAASGGNSILNANSHTKTRTTSAVVNINVVTSGSGGATYLSGDTGA